MMRGMRWLLVVGALCGCGTKAQVTLPEPTPVDSGDGGIGGDGGHSGDGGDSGDGGVGGELDCEGIRAMRALFEAQRSFLQERDRYSQNLAEVGFSPAACADGSRAPVPGPGQVAGCQFAYQVTSVTSLPASFTAIAQGAAGTPAADMTLQIGSTTNHDIFFWLEHSGVRRYVDWNECRPTGSFSAQEFEAVENMGHAFRAMQASYVERDRYPSTLLQAGFVPMGCTDGSSAPLPGPDWVAGCHFAYRVSSVTGSPTPSFTVTAQGAAGTPVADVTLQIGSPSFQTIVFWIERSGGRRFIAWEEREPTRSVCDVQEEEGLVHIQALYTMERAIFQERDRYSSNLAELGFLPLSCTDGTRPTGPDSSWLGGCRFIFHVEVTSPSTFIATARAVSGPIAGTTFQIDETGTRTYSPVRSAACP